MALYDCPKCDEIKYPESIVTYQYGEYEQNYCVDCSHEVTKREPRDIDLTKPMVCIVQVDVDDDMDDIPF